MATSAKKKLLGFSGLVLLFAVSWVLGYLVSHHRGLTEVETEWRAYKPPQITNLGATNTLAILPLVNWHTAQDQLQGEMGVSYLIRTDAETVLFDVGQNTRGTDPSPLQHNMAALDISVNEIDSIFISHNHFDHVGGKNWSRENTFSLGVTQIPLPGKRIYTPIAMSYPNQQPKITNEPQVLAQGIATTGTIPRQLFMGRIDEQALVINVADKGLVLIVGCGHQRLQKLISRTQSVFSQPIYGIIGDLHYPVPEGRLTLLGMNAQLRFASGDWPWHPLTEKDVTDNIELLRSLNLGVVGLGSHDSSDAVITRFSETFGDRYEKVLVGSWINIAPGKSE